MQALHPALHPLVPAESACAGPRPFAWTSSPTAKKAAVATVILMGCLLVLNSRRSNDPCASPNSHCCLVVAGGALYFWICLPGPTLAGVQLLVVAFSTLQTGGSDRLLPGP